MRGSRTANGGSHTAKWGVTHRKNFFKPSNGAGLRPVDNPNTFNTFKTIKGNSSGPLLPEGRLLY